MTAEEAADIDAKCEEPYAASAKYPIPEDRLARMRPVFRRKANTGGEDESAA